MTPLPLQPVIMAGGSGTRLWPLSRAFHPCDRFQVKRILVESVASLFNLNAVSELAV
jgi:mannose-1-phosphate guanylyltransferase